MICNSFGIIFFFPFHISIAQHIKMKKKVKVGDQWRNTAWSHQNHSREKGLFNSLCILDRFSFRSKHVSPLVNSLESIFNIHVSVVFSP